MVIETLSPRVHDAIVLALQEGRDPEVIANRFGLRREVVVGILLDYETGHRHGGERDGAIPPAEVLASLIREAERLTEAAIPFLEARGRLRSSHGTAPLSQLTPAEGDALRESIRRTVDLRDQLVAEDAARIEAARRAKLPPDAPELIAPGGDNGEWHD